MTTKGGRHSGHRENIRMTDNEEIPERQSGYQTREKKNILSLSPECSKNLKHRH